MTERSPLGELSTLAGILPAYHDIWGKRHLTSDATRRALLGAMGISCGTPEEIAESIHALQARPWRRWLPPVHVGPVGQPLRLSLCLPAAMRDTPMRWRLLLEDGGQLEGEFIPSGLKAGKGASFDAQDYQAWWLVLPPLEQPGYHRLEVEGAGETASLLLVIHPPTAFRPEAVEEDGRVWGLATQLYGVRSARNWGMGDFTDLRHLIEWAAQAGAGVIGVNPLHALFPHNPLHASPYSPSSRRFLNALYIDPEAAPEFHACREAQEVVAAPEFQARLRALRAAPLVDYAELGPLKLRILEMLYQHLRDHHLQGASERGQAFRAFQAQGGKELEQFALYHALQEHFHRMDPAVWGWPVWPEPYRDHASAKVAAFAETQRERVEFHQYLQWLAAEQCEGAGWRSLELGLGLGLYLDLAVGVEKGGAEVWVHRDLYALEARIGCPPDEFNPLGQDWGLPPWIPHRLQDAAYAPYIAMLRASMRFAGALRMDHVMGLMRLFWVPPGMRGDQGAYVAYPFHDLLGILLLESHRNRCLVIGEDLGTVPDEIRAAMHETGVLSYRLFYFERDEVGGFLPPARYPEQALVGVSTHDLPTLAGFWQGSDLDLRASLKLYPDEARRASDIVGRAEDRARLLVALEREGLLPEGYAVHPVGVPEMSPAFARAIHRYLARTPARVALVQAEDMLGEGEQVNLPGTTDQHPNWRRKLSLNLEEWRVDARILALAEAMVAERGRAVKPLEPVPFPLRTVRVPRATYRLQFNRDFGFGAARELVPYLAELGVSHLYCSPYFNARQGSEHGYDIIDHGRLNPEIGDEAALEALAEGLAAHGMGQILDMVPNHMGIMGADNPRWLDVLEHGEASSSSGFFDIDWNPIEAELRGKVIVPVLGDHYGNVLERGELQLRLDEAEGSFSLWYFEHCLPIDPREYPRILGHRLEEMGARLGEEHPVFLEFQSLIAAFAHLPPRDALDADSRGERQRDTPIHKRRLADLLAASADLQQFLRENIEAFNGRVGEPASFDALHELIDAQAYRPAYWRVAADEINYRRFFDINDLAALRMEREEVFKATHALVFRLLQRGIIHGLRIDHVDGLFEPAIYLERVQGLYREARPEAREGLYVVVEKVLAAHERLREDWAAAGTTGYEIGHLINGLFVDGNARERMLRTWRNFTGEHENFDAVLLRARRVIMRSALASELNVLANRLSRIADLDRHTRDFTLNALRRALREIVACFPVYRTYLRAGQVAEEDRRHIVRAWALARRLTGAADTSVYDFVRDVLLGSIAEGKNENYRQVVRDFAMRFQQFTSPVMAKGMEDTAFYRYLPLASLNEVGGNPRVFGVDAESFHGANQRRLKHHPHGMVSTGTHDSKRSEDVRARLNVLSEASAPWRQQLSRWHRINRGRLTEVDGMPAPTRRDEYLLYQTLLGSWPEVAPDTPEHADWAGRIGAYMVKAVREAKERSSWVNPAPDYEDAVQRFVEAILDPVRGRRFLEAFRPFATQVAHFGRINSLAQTLLKLTVPGVPDIYQGNELWDLSLVDPDNRRPVDYDLRRRHLSELRRIEEASGRRELCRQLLAEAGTGVIKLHLVRMALGLRGEFEPLFASGSYMPLEVEGAWSAHACAFARQREADTVVVIVPRLAYTLLQGQGGWPVGQVWQDTRVILPSISRRWRNVLTGEELRLDQGAEAVPLSALLADFPLALLVADAEN
ncbi:MAG: malto-oligosyltrehalose synthase [Pseudomonadota bacterium]